MAPLLGHCKYTQIEMGFGVAWIDGQRVPVALHCFGRAAQAGKRICHPDEGICKLRPDADGYLVVAQCMREFAGAIIQVAQIEVGRYIPGIARYRQLVRAASLINLGAREQNVAAVQVCWRALRVAWTAAS